MKKLVFTNDKGGVSKTTTVANLSVGLARQGHKTLVVDMDPQGDVTFAILGARPPLISDVDKNKPLPRTTYTLILERYDLAEAIIKAPRYPNLYIVPSNKDLAQANAHLAMKAGSQTLLLRILKTLQPDAYDFVLIDTGKGLDLLVINSLAAADEVVIMTTPGRFELDAVERMIHHVEEVRRATLLGAEHPKIRGIVLAYADHYTVAQDTKAFLEDKYPGQMFHTIIPKNDDLRKAISRAQSIFEFNPGSKGAQAYELLLKEVFPNGK